MGLFSEAATSSTEDEAPNLLPSGATKTAPEEEPQTELPPEQEPVAVPVPKPPSRRAQAAEALKLDVANQVKAVEERFRNELSQRDSEMRRLQSELAMRPVHVVQPQYQPQAPAVPADPDQLMREANEALDRKDLDGYHRKLMAANDAAMERKWAPRFAAQQPQVAQQPQIDPRLNAIIAQYPEVSDHQNGIQLAIIEDAKLNALGHPPGPARIRAAFAAAHATITSGKQPNRAQYDQSAAGALGGAPTGRGSGAAAAGQPSIMMSPDEERTMRSLAKKSGMTWDEYVSDLAAHRPEMVRR